MFLNRETACVLVIDFQPRLFQVMDGKEDLLNNTVKLLKGCKELGLPVIATEQYPQGLGATMEEVRSLLDENRIFSKMSFSAYPVIKGTLEAIKPQSIILLGIESHICVYQTCRDLLHNKYQVWVPYECVSSRNPHNVQNALRLMERMGAWVSNVETVLFDLLKTAEAPEFKTISKLIK